MEINGVGAGKVINLYNKNKNVTEKKQITPAKDSLEISKIGKSLSAYSIDETLVNSDSKVEEVKKQILNGTYDRDAKLVAQKLALYMKGKEV